MKHSVLMAAALALTSTAAFAADGAMMDKPMEKSMGMEHMNTDKPMDKPMDVSGSMMMKADDGMMMKKDMPKPMEKKMGKKMMHKEGMKKDAMMKKAM